MLLYIVMGTVFLFVVIFILFLGTPAFQKKDKKSAIKRIAFFSTITKKESGEIPSFFERAMVPFLRKIASFVKRISPKGVVEANRRRLELSGTRQQEYLPSPPSEPGTCAGQRPRL